jgi:DNA-binding LacI/PurR family transcriptional regulator
VTTEPLTYSFSDPAALDLVAGMAQSCEELGQGLLLVAVGPSRSVAEGTAAVFSAGVDGFVMYSASADDPSLQVVLQRWLPVVVVNQPKDVPGVSRVGIDDRAAMREIADYVIGLGHPAIGLLTMRLSRERRQGLVDPERIQSPKSHVQRERINGVRDAMSAGGIAPDSLTVVESYEHVPNSGGSAAEVALDANPRITALMCTAVTGFDGVPEAINRGLTTVARSSLLKGRRAGALLQRINGHLQPSPATPPQASVGAAALGDTGRRSAGH